MMKCTGCNKHFSRLTSFDHHRVGTFREQGKRGRKGKYSGSGRRCMTAQEMLDSGLIRAKNGAWKLKGPEEPLGLWRKEDAA